MRRNRNGKIVATLGPASSSRETIEALFKAGVDVFRLNFSHGTHEDHRLRLEQIRSIEQTLRRPISVLLDLQGPKLRIGTFANGPVRLEQGAAFRLDLDVGTAGTVTRVALPHPEIFAALKPHTKLLLDDGRIQLKVERCGAGFAETTVVIGGMLSERKGVNVPDVVLPVSAMTEKDHRDLQFGLSLGVDWVALSFVQRPEDIQEVRAIVGERAGIIAKLEKPAAIHLLDDIVAQADAIMVARGDLGVEMPAEQVPAIQKRIVRACRKAGKPVIVATQMLESMIAAPVPTRAEASDVATAIYDGADAVMLSAESASGSYPVEAVRMMELIIAQTESDPYYREAIAASVASVASTASATSVTSQRGQSIPRVDSADAIGYAMRHVTGLLDAVATVAYTSSGYSALRMARERPGTPILGMTPRQPVARRLALVWGVHPVLCREVIDVLEVSDLACRTVQEEGFGSSGQTVVISAGMPFGTPGTTNLLRIAQIG